MRKVVYAKLQGTDAFIPGVGGLGTTLPPNNKSIGLEMYDVGDKLLLRISSKGSGQRLNPGEPGVKNGVLEAFVPITNVQVAVYAEPLEKSDGKQKADNSAGKP